MIIGLLDTENAPNIAATWGIHDQVVRYTDIIQEWFFLSAQFKKLGDKRTQSICILQDKKRFRKDHTDDYIVVKKCHEFISSVDVLVGHNLKGHDLKKLYAKFLEHGLEPPDEPFIVDTYQVSKKFGFTSRKLGDLCKKLDLVKKLEHEPGIFILASQGDPAAIRKVLKYGLGDIPTLEKLYLKFRPFIKNHPNQNAYALKACCPVCGSGNFHKRGRERGKQTYACECTARFNEDSLKKLGKFR